MQQCNLVNPEGIGPHLGRASLNTALCRQLGSPCKPATDRRYSALSTKDAPAFARWSLLGGPKRRGWEVGVSQEKHRRNNHVDTVDHIGPNLVDLQPSATRSKMHQNSCCLAIFGPLSATRSSASCVGLFAPGVHCRISQPHRFVYIVEKSTLYDGIASSVVSPGRPAELGQFPRLAGSGRYEGSLSFDFATSFLDAFGDLNLIRGLSDDHKHALFYLENALLARDRSRLEEQVKNLKNKNTSLEIPSS